MIKTFRKLHYEAKRTYLQSLNLDIDQSVKDMLKEEMDYYMEAIIWHEQEERKCRMDPLDEAWSASMTESTGPEESLSRFASGT